MATVGYNQSDSAPPRLPGLFAHPDDAVFCAGSSIIEPGEPAASLYAAR